MPISSVMEARIKKIGHTMMTYRKGTPGAYNALVIADFALFVDTHRDQPHIGSFHQDIHRGQSRPVWVDYEPSADALIEQSTGTRLARHDKHMFITDEWFSNFIVEQMMNGNGDPRDKDGILATSHLRDARAKRYFLKSFRQVVMERYWDELKGGPRVPRPR